MHGVCSRILAVCLALSLAAPVLAQMRVEETSEPKGWKVFDGDQLIAGYLADSHGKPVVYPVIGPSGQEMTRRYPIEDALDSEEKDHPHHRSMWFTHGEVNDIDFWIENAKSQGHIVQRAGNAAITPEGIAVIVTDNDWNGPDGKPVLSDTRRFAFFKDGDRRMIDFDVLIKANVGDVHFGDTKEGSFGIRVPGTMKVDAKLGGLITTAEGDTNEEAWGKKSPWVDYSGPVSPIAGQAVAAGESIAGITIHDHPASFGYPCRWHVRTYGLFAANPFGVYHFTGGTKTSGVVLKHGSQMRLSYRVILHDGGLDTETAAKDSAQFANDPRPEL